MNGELVGAWSLPARGAHTFTYAEFWLHSSQFRPLSLSLPAGLGTSTLSGGSGLVAISDACIPRCHPQACGALVRPQWREGFAVEFLSAHMALEVCPRWYGPGAEGHLRLSFATSAGLLEEGLNRLAADQV